mmetsp:Transcript_29071/g.69460  ORF Transcript_29071/g.69460 Transcript_29071/m.69460 type:complete len:308 (-) Transcript_29071:43-966(-)
MHRGNPVGCTRGCLGAGVWEGHRRGRPCPRGGPPRGRRYRPGGGRPRSARLAHARVGDAGRGQRPPPRARRRRRGPARGARATRRAGSRHAQVRRGAPRGGQEDGAAGRHPPVCGPPARGPPPVRSGAAGGCPAGEPRGAGRAHEGRPRLRAARRPSGCLGRGHHDPTGGPRGGSGSLAQRHRPRDGAVSPPPPSFPVSISGAPKSRKEEDQDVPPTPERRLCFSICTERSRVFQRSRHVQNPCPRCVCPRRAPFPKPTSRTRHTCPSDSPRLGDGARRLRPRRTACPMNNSPVAPNPSQLCRSSVL